GVDSHRAGFGNMLEELAPNQKGQPGYEGYLNERVVTLPTLLQDAGYQTFITGKWHLGSGEGRGPAWRGFDRSFVLESGGASHFADMRPAYAPTPDVKAHYSEDGVQLDRLSDTFEYSSQYYADKMIDYLAVERDASRPFFAFLSFTAPHWPLQAPDDALARQRGRYDQGYDAISDARLARMIELGLVPENTKRAGRSPKEKPWSDLDEEERRSEIRAMEIYAAMIDEVDRHTGRLIDVLEDRGVLDDTVILFMSDNGPEGHDLDETWPMEAFPDIRRTIDTSHDFSYEAMGKPGSYVLYGPAWANAGSPPFRLHKAFPTEGGSRVTAFIRYPAEFTEPRIEHDFVYITDIAPTLLAMTNVMHPGVEYQGRPVEPMVGHSMLWMTTEPGLRDRKPRVAAMELIGKRVVRSGDWKLVHMPPPYGSGDWQLFNLQNDPAESKDIADENAEIVEFLKTEWEAYVRANNVVIPDWVSGY
ncbi:MAG: sulfatase-like hydrolase/transferase, partial [Gammaproteobacteria bacterium]|nr:sulfatase-like hydrolase/transferase [Gammaproteobacteria bacterium]